MRKDSFVCFVFHLFRKSCRNPYKSATQWNARRFNLKIHQFILSLFLFSLCPVCVCVCVHRTSENSNLLLSLNSVRSLLYVSSFSASILVFSSCCNLWPWVKLLFCFVSFRLSVEWILVQTQRRSMKNMGSNLQYYFMVQHKILAFWIFERWNMDTWNIPFNRKSSDIEIIN